MAGAVGSPHLGDFGEGVDYPLEGQVEFFLAVLELLLQLMAVEGHLDVCVEFHLVEGLDEIAERAGLLGPKDEVPVGVGREEDHRQVVAGADPLRRLDAVQLSGEDDVHEDQIRFRLLDQGEGLHRRGGDVLGIIAERP